MKVPPLLFIYRHKYIEGYKLLPTTFITVAAILIVTIPLLKQLGWLPANPPPHGIFAALMQAPVKYKTGNQTFWLSPLRSLFWEEEKALILSDLHFGKSGHFRKAGIAVPQNVFKEDLQRLVSLLHYFNPQKIIAVGDLFHSKANLELELFKRWRADFPPLEFHLVKGNHDILGEAWYKEAGLTLWQDSLTIQNIRFTHDYCTDDTGNFTFCGHLHPGITINGLGKQSLRFPCFYFTTNHCILPAFSKFTGTAAVKPKATDTVFAIVENSLLKM